MPEHDSLQNAIEHLRSLKPEEADRALRRMRLLGVPAGAGSALAPSISSLGEYLARDLPVPPELVRPRLVVRGGVVATIGRAGKGKTKFNLNRLMCWAAGADFIPGSEVMQPTAPLKTLVIENEGSAGLFQDDLKKMARNGPFDPEQRNELDKNFHVWGDGGYSGMKLDEEAWRDKLSEGCDTHDPDIVFIEPFRQLWSGDENSATEMNVVLDCLMSLSSEYECAVIIAHHERKGGVSEDGEWMSAARGSSVLEGAVAVMENYRSVAGDQYREVSWSKNRYGNKPAPVRLSWQGHDSQWYKHVADSTSAKQVLELLGKQDGGHLFIKDMAEELGETQDKVRKWLLKLEKDERVKRLPSVSDGQGTTGQGWRLSTGTPNGTAGVDF